MIPVDDVPRDDTLDDRERVRDFWRIDLARADEPQSIEFLGGGVSSIVVRVTSEDGAFVIKQAIRRLRVQADWYSRPERSAIDARCAQVLAELVPGSTPEVIAVVPRRNAFVMRSAPLGTETWKDRLLRGIVDTEVASAVGRLLGRLHAASAPRRDLAVAFADRSFFDELRIDPYLRYVAAATPDLARTIGGIADKLLSPGSCLVHGDFSPKNLLVAPDRHVLLVDHEVAHWGHPAFDVAFVTSHLCLKAMRFRGQGMSAAYLDAAAAVLDAYAQEARHLEGGIGRFAAQTVGALLLARVDGKSPVEYLTDEPDREFARALGRSVVLDPPDDPWAVLDRARDEISRG